LTFFEKQGEEEADELLGFMLDASVMSLLLARPLPAWQAT